MTIQLYKCSAESNRIDKSDFLTYVATITGTLREETSILEPTIILEYISQNFNYIFIEEFNRYYFVDDIIIISNKLMSISLSVDVLMSYKDEIKELNGFVLRNEFNFNPFIIDDKLPVEVGTEILTMEIPSNVFMSDENSITGSYLLNGFYIGGANIDT